MSNNRIMPTTLENLPNELLLKVTPYLNQAHTDKAFSGLNARFDLIHTASIQDRVNNLIKKLNEVVSVKELKKTIDDLEKIHNRLSPLQKQQIKFVMPQEMHIDVTQDYAQKYNMEQLVVNMEKAQRFLQINNCAINIELCDESNYEYNETSRDKTNLIKHLLRMGIKPRIIIVEIKNLLDQCFPNNADFKNNITALLKSKANQLVYYNLVPQQTFIPSVKTILKDFFCYSKENMNTLISFLKQNPHDLQDILFPSKKLNIGLSFKTFDNIQDVRNQIKKLFEGCVNQGIKHIQLTPTPQYPFYPEVLNAIIEQALNFKGKCHIGVQKDSSFSIENTSQNTKKVIFDLNFLYYYPGYQERNIAFLELIKDPRITNLEIAKDDKNILQNPNNEIMRALKERTTPLQSFVVKSKSMMHMLENSFQVNSARHVP